MYLETDEPKKYVLLVVTLLKCTIGMSHLPVYSYWIVAYIACSQWFVVTVISKRFEATYLCNLSSHYWWSEKPGLATMAWLAPLLQLTLAQLCLVVHSSKRANNTECHTTLQLGLVEHGQYCTRHAWIDNHALLLVSQLDSFVSHLHRTQIEQMQIHHLITCLLHDWSTAAW